MLDVSSFLTPGAQYTVTLEPSGLLSYLEHPDPGTLQSALAGVSNISNAQLGISSPPGIGGTDYYNVTFVYAGDGSDVMANIYQAIADQWEQVASISTWNLVGANAGDQGVSQQNPGAVNFNLPSSSYLWAFAALAIIALFVYTGGATATRRALA